MKLGIKQLHSYNNLKVLSHVDFVCRITQYIQCVAIKTAIERLLISAVLTSFGANCTLIMPD